MYCNNCGSEITGNNNFCEVCGAPIAPMTGTVPPQMTEKEFYKAYAPKGTKGLVIFVCVSCYLTSVLCFSMGLMMSWIYLFDAVLFLALGILNTLYKKWTFVLAVVIYNVLRIIASIASGGEVGGMYALAVAVCAVIGLRKVNKNYEEYKKTGIINNNGLL